jgi:hypothetical protein
MNTGDREGRHLMHPTKEYKNLVHKNVIKV